MYNNNWNSSYINRRERNLVNLGLRLRLLWIIVVIKFITEHGVVYARLADRGYGLDQGDYRYRE